MRAEENLREQIAATNQGMIRFEHEGRQVKRWLTGGLAPSITVTFSQENDQIICHCPNCNQEIGRFDSNYGERVPSQINAIRYASVDHKC